MEENLFEMMQVLRKSGELEVLNTCNEKSERFGLILMPEQQRELIEYRDTSLRKSKRVEFGEGILKPLIDEFCDSQYINQNQYLETLKKLTDIFYEFKNESGDLLTDAELLTFMREQFEGVCYGSLEYLEGTCLPVFAEGVRNGYRGYEASGGHGEYTDLDEVPRWDNDLYMEIVKELFW